MFHNIIVFLYFWSNKCNFGEHEASLKKNQKNVTNPDIFNSKYIYIYIHFVLSDTFCVDFDVCFWLLSWWKIQTRPIIRFLTEAVGVRFFIYWYLIE